MVSRFYLKFRQPKKPFHFLFLGKPLAAPASLAQDADFARLVFCVTVEDIALDLVLRSRAIYNPHCALRISP
jgi:hypothetical protein